MRDAVFVRGKGVFGGQIWQPCGCRVELLCEARGVFFWGRGGVRWTGPFCAAGNWCLGVWKRAEDDAEVVLAEYSAECRGSAVGSWSWENRVRG